MSKLRIVMCALAVGLILLLPGFSQIVNFGVKTGLWESTVAVQTSGMPQVPADALARMTPEQRAQVEAAMGGAAQPRTYKTCITPQKLQHGFQLDDTQRPNCKQTIVSNSTSVMELRVDCSDSRGNTSVNLHYESTSPTTVTGKMHMTMTRGSNTMTSDGTVQGKWISDDCGDVK